MLAIWLVFCQIQYGQIVTCLPWLPETRKYAWQPNWDDCTAEMKKRNALINENARRKLWPNDWQYFCKAGIDER